MPDLREIFETATEQVEPSANAWAHQERHQRRAARDRRVGGFAAAAAIVLLAGVLVVVLRNGGDATKRPGSKVGPGIVPSGSPTSLGFGTRRMEMEVFGLDGSVRSTVPGLPVGANSAVVSPDGRSIAFVAQHDGTSVVGTIGMDGTGLRFVSDPTFSAVTPAWSPDGSRIAFGASLVGDVNTDIYLMDPDGSNLQRLTTSPAADQDPAWSADGSTILYDNAGTEPLGADGLSLTQELFTVPARGGTPTRLTHNHVSDVPGSYSPDGRRLTFFRDGNIWVMDPDGSHAGPIVSRPYGSTNFAPRWSPDGSRISFTTCCDFQHPATVVHPGGAVAPCEGFFVRFVEVSSRRVTTLRVDTPCDFNFASWLPSGSAVLVNVPA